MAEKPEVIRHQMEETRAALTEKIEALEEKVVGTVQEATSAVSETVDTIKEATQETVGTVKDTVQETVSAVRDTFDLELQFQRHPWVLLGGSVAVGYVAGRLLDRSAGPAPRPETPRVTPAVAQTNGHAEKVLPPPAEEPKGAWLGPVNEALQPGLTTLKGLAIGTLMALVRDAVTRSLSDEAGMKLREVMDDVTVRLGGQPLHEPIIKSEVSREEIARMQRPPGTPAWASAAR